MITQKELRVNMFQFALPRGERPYAQDVRDALEVSIRAPAWGATRVCGQGYGF